MDAADVFRVGYCDLSLPSNVPKSERDALLRDAARLGYQVVAIDHRMTKLPAGFKVGLNSALTTYPRGSGELTCPDAPLPQAPKLPSDLHGLRVLRRLTLTSSSPTSLSTLVRWPARGSGAPLAASVPALNPAPSRASDRLRSPRLRHRGCGGEQ